MSDFSALQHLRPVRFLTRGGPKPGDILFQPLIFGPLIAVPAVAVFLPARIVSLLHLDVRPVNRKNMVNRPVEQIPVVGDQQESLLRGKVTGHPLPARRIEVIGRLVDQGKAVGPEKEGAKLQAGPLTIAQGVKWPVEQLPEKAPSVQFPAQSTHQRWYPPAA